ncbi:hypothetical protein ASG90_05070 [Nocardioides sp. Soil797]|nr:hypothetical protein ASG90_05070 [Nocardioides sp. Soil797]
MNETTTHDTDETRTKRSWRSRRVLVPAVAALAVVGIGGGLLAAGAADDGLRGDTRDRAAEAAIEEVGGGTVTEAEKDDGFYEVEVTREDGTEVDIRLDQDYRVVDTETDGPDGDDDDGYDDGYDDRDTDDKPLSAAETKSATTAARAEIDGTVTDVDREFHGRTLGFEVEVTKDDGTEWNVQLDQDFTVLGSHRD